MHVVNGEAHRHHVNHVARRVNHGLGLGLEVGHELGGDFHKVRILYGGSVNAKNAADFAISGIDGVLVGGASLDAQAFSAIARSI